MGTGRAQLDIMDKVRALSAEQMVAVEGLIDTLIERKENVTDGVIRERPVALLA